MTGLDIKSDTEVNAIDLVEIINEFAISSSIKNDPLFWGNNINKVIFCGGKILNFNLNVFNFKKNQFVGFISNSFKPKLAISSNMIFPLEKKNKKLIAILPYASYAMKILREVDPKLGDNIIIFGLNFFSILLFNLLKMSGAGVHIIKTNQDTYTYNDNNDIEKIIIKNFNQLKELSKSINVNHIIFISELVNRNNEFIKQGYIFKYAQLHFIGANLQNDLNILKGYEINRIFISDKGFLDSNYLRGIKYPYSYVRWDYKRNLEYFIFLIRKKIINLDFFNLELIKINNLENLLEKINNIPKNRLTLFENQA